MIVIKISQKKALGILIQFKYKQMVFLDFIQHVSSISFNVFLNIVRITNLSSGWSLQNWLIQIGLRDVNATARLALLRLVGELILMLPWRAGVAQSGHVLRK